MILATWEAAKQGEGAPAIRPWVRSRATYLNGNSALILALPKAMYDVYLDEMSCIRVESIHQKVDIMEEVELPTFCNEGITKQVSQAHCIPVVLLW